MPHIIVEYSRNLDDAVDIQDLLGALHQAALASGVFPRGGLRTRAACRDHYEIADGDKDNGFVHVLIKIGQGRDLATKKRAAGLVFDALCGHLADHYEKSALAISLEVQEIDPALSLKKNNLHQIIKERGAG